MVDQKPDVTILAARILIAALFLAGAVQKLLVPEAAAALLTGIGLPGALVWLVMLFNGFSAVALILGWQVRLVAFALAGYCGLTSAFHFIPSDPWQMSIFVKNWAIAGGCLALAALYKRDTVEEEATR